ncbi:MAG: polysaccharide biosynthesis/export family protein, partial [Pseudomonadota bacterium]
MTGHGIHRWLAPVAFVLTLAVAGIAAAQTPYAISVGDRLSIFLPGAVASEERLVDADGAVALDGIGRVSVAGRSFAEVEQAIAAAAEETGALVAPTITVGILEYAPVMVFGAVRTPGEVTFRPGLTAVDAVGLASGISFVGLDPNTVALQRLGLEADLRTAGDRLIRLQNQRGELEKRLELDAALRATVAELMPEGEAADGTGPEARAEIAAAAAAMGNGRAATEIETAAALLDLWQEAIKENERQVELLQQRMAAQERIRDLNEEELARNTELVDRGILAPNTLPEFARQLTASEATLLEVESALSLIRNRIVDLEEERSRFLGAQRSQLLTEFARINEEIAAVIAQRRALRFRLTAVAG